MMWGKKSFCSLMMVVALLGLMGCKQVREQSKTEQGIQAQEEVNQSAENEEGKRGATPADKAEEKKETEKKETEKKEIKKEDLEKGEKVQKKDEEKKEEYAGRVQKLEEPKIYYATLNLNVRKGPATSYTQVGALQIGQGAKVTGIAENGWYQIEFGKEMCYASNNYLVETKEEVEEIQKRREEERQLQAAEAEKTVQPTSVVENVQTSQPVRKTTPSGGIIMIGDSRCVQMQEAVQGGGCSWICENSKGYQWLEEVAIGWADPSVGKGTKVVFCLGVNDPQNVKKYADLVNAKGAEWRERGAVIYYVSVNPVWENPYTSKEEVENFNATMPGLLSGVIWVDTYSWLMENGCKIVDGLHYDAATSATIFNLIMGSI